MTKIETTRCERETPTLHTAAVLVDGVTVAMLMRDPTASMSEWYSHESEVRLPDGRVAGLPDQDWGPSLRRARGYVVAHLRGYLSNQ